MQALVVASKPRSGSVLVIVLGPQCKEFGELNRATPPDQTCTCERETQLDSVAAVAVDAKFVL
jgi:hypothetical protein